MEFMEKLPINHRVIFFPGGLEDVYICEGMSYIVTGICCSMSGHPRLEKIKVTAATVSTRKNAVKFWPDKEIDNGKLWFNVNEIEEISYTMREESWNKALDFAAKLVEERLKAGCHDVENMTSSILSHKKQHN